MKSASAYRMVETGNMVLQPVYAGAVAWHLKNLVWSRLVAFLVCVQAADSFKSNLDQYWRCIEKTARLDKDLDSLIQEGLVSMRTQFSGEARQIWIDALRSYLESKPVIPAKLGPLQTESLKSWAALAPGTISPIHLDIVLQGLDGLKFFPSHVPPERIFFWEDQHREAIKSVLAFVQDLGVIAKIAQDFEWGYMSSSAFKSLTIIYSNGSEKDKNDIINTIRLKQSQLGHTGDLTDKLDFRRLSRADAAEIKNSIKYDIDKGQLIRQQGRKPGTQQLRNVWLYSLTRYEIVVGFSDSFAGKKNRQYLSVTLSKAEVASMLAMLMPRCR